MRSGLSTCMIQGGRTGVAQYVIGLVGALLTRPDRPELTLFVLENDVPLFKFAQGRSQIVPVPERFRGALSNIAWHQLALPRLVEALRLDVLHVPSYRRLLWSKRCALVGTIHDLAPFHVRGKYDPARMLYGRTIVPTLARRQDQVIAVSRNTAADIKRFLRVAPARVQVIWNGIDHSRFYPGETSHAQLAVAKRWDLAGPFLLYVSRLEHPGKNHVRLIEAFALFRARTGLDWSLVLGGSDWHGAETIRRAAQASPARAAIRFAGFVPEPDLPNLYRAASAVVYPSLFEGFGLPPVEAMACGCPVLSSRRGALAEVVAEAAGLLEPEDVEQMARALERVALDAAWRQQLCRIGLQNAQRFRWETNAEETLSCYRRAVVPRKLLASFQPPIQLMVR